MVVIWNLTTGRNINSSEAWTKLDAAKKAEERLDVAKEFPDSQASKWAAFRRPTNITISHWPTSPITATSLSLSSRRHSTFLTGSRRRLPKIPSRPAAALGKARSLEARNELGKAIDQYELVVKNWPGTPEADQAKLIAEGLRKPEAAGFYKDLYAFSPTKMTLPALDTERLDLPPTGVNPAGDKMTPPPTPTPAVKFPLELAPPTVEEKRKLEKLEAPATSKPSSPSAKTDSAPNPAAKSALPLEVLAPRADAPAEKPAPR